ncbi:hypothetical protein ACOME3_007282 [Neoechinorhynchus agilis]
MRHENDSSSGTTMRALVLAKIEKLTSKSSNFLHLIEVPKPVPLESQVLVAAKVLSLYFFRTDIDEIEGRLKVEHSDKTHTILGHQIIGTVVQLGPNVGIILRVRNVCIVRNKHGCPLQVVAITTKGQQSLFNSAGQQNLCSKFKATGCHVQGGYAEYIAVPEDACFAFTTQVDMEHAPLLCAGAIGNRALRLANIENKNNANIGFIGFGACGHLMLKMCSLMPTKPSCYVFARSPNQKKFAIDLGAVWTGDCGALAPTKLDVIVDTTPTWMAYIYGLRNLKPGGRLVVNAIRKESDDKAEMCEILSYAEHLWMEREIKSVANITPDDIQAMVSMINKCPDKLKSEVEVVRPEKAEQAILNIKFSGFIGAKVIQFH